jgi:hypothetical protein
VLLLLLLCYATNALPGCTDSEAPRDCNVVSSCMSVIAQIDASKVTIGSSWKPVLQAFHKIDSLTTAPLHCRFALHYTKHTTDRCFLGDHQEQLEASPARASQD